MTNTQIDHKRLHAVELEFNTIQHNGLKLGMLLSFHFDRLYRNDYQKNWFHKFVVFIYYFIKPVSKRQILKDHKKDIIYFCTGAHRHHQSMQSALSDCHEIDTNTVYISPRNKQCIDGSVFFFSNIFDYFRTLFFLLVKFNRFNSILKPLAFPLKLKLHLLTDLHLQMLKATSLRKFVQLQSDAKLVAADYDRGSASSLFFAVAKSLQVRSFTFQHGVLNPPVGYSPVNADEIWVWGEMAKKQLLELGVPPGKIRITGTPIVQNIELTETIRKSLTNKYQLKPGKNIVLALSNPNKPNDIKLVEFFSAIKKQHGNTRDNFLVKIHPARNYKEYNWIKDIYDIDLLPHDIPYQDFMNMVDILLAHTSGIAAEVLYYNKKVGVLDILEQSPGNGYELNKYFGVPLLKQSSEFEHLYNKTPSNIGETLFYKVGNEANLEIQKNIIQQVSTKTNSSTPHSPSKPT